MVVSNGYELLAVTYIASVHFKPFGPFICIFRGVQVAPIDRRLDYRCNPAQSDHHRTDRRGRSSYESCSLRTTLEQLTSMRIVSLIFSYRACCTTLERQPFTFHRLVRRELLDLVIRSIVVYFHRYVSIESLSDQCIRVDFTIFR